MGNEAKCDAVIDGEALVGTALLETDELLFRRTGAPRRVFRFAELSSVEATDGRLSLVTRDGVRASFTLGAQAEKWAAKIRSPKGRLDKLGVTADVEVCLAGAALDEEFQRELRSRTGAVRERAPTASTRLVFLGVERSADLDRLAALREQLAPDCPVWVVYPKGRKEPSEAQVLAAGRAAGWKDVKVARFSDSHTALKFVVPVAARGR